MADYEITSAYYVTYDPVTGTMTVGDFVPYPGIATNNDPLTDVFSVGDIITYDPSPGPGYSEIFEGYTDQGIMTSLNGQYFLEGNNPNLSGDVLDVTIGNFTVCFCAGTLIATPQGERRVEDLAIGDVVVTASGDTRQVLWIGRQSVVTRFAEPQRSHPIRISAGALGECTPSRDLLVSPDHALLVEGVLIQAGALVNGTSIRRETALAERFTYYHIELEDHALVLAEGAATETFVDNVTRRRFDNYAEFVALFGECEARMPEMDYPRVKSARQVPASIRARLDARASAIGEAVEQAA